MRGKSEMRCQRIVACLPGPVKPDCPVPTPMSAFLDVPSEVLLLIISYLNVPEVFLLRQICREVSQLTRDKSLWLAFLEHLRNSGEIPLPSAASDPAVPDVDLSSATIESIVVSATRVSDSWLLPREIRPIPTAVPGEVIDGLSIFLDTWLLIVYANGLVYLRSIREHAPQRGHYATLDLRDGARKRWMHAASLAPGNNRIMLALSNTFAPFETVLYEIDIDSTDSTGADFKLLQTFAGHRTRTIRALDVASRLLVLSSAAGALDVVSWDSERQHPSTMSLDSDEGAEERFDGVVSIRLLGSHFLAIRTHTIELHACNDAARPERSMLPLKHRLPFPLREGSISVSDVITTSTADSGARSIRINVLAYDAHSLASYAVSIFLPSLMDDVHPAMDVALTGEVRPAPSQAHTGVSVTRSHWFVSALALGSQAIRAMWVERHSLTMTRHVRLCTLNRNATMHEMKTAARVFTLASYDLREDLTHCALAEVSGHIVLGNRAGNVFLLTPTRAPQRSN
ncbi:hypothetical protein B0H17DRAFT_1031367 [Mycena rosella]|uniref:F-box domain-containing protein n=1 Tax=Mycena rosella TaxID=1033263 RepID=A0AAD7MB88_MYCRO|nr:hypothetical protein B0H17DRAFT_1031367 [Mycena rosella]